MKTMLRHAYFLTIILCVSCAENKKLSESNSLEVRLNKDTYSLGEKIHIRIINESDSTALFQQCTSETDIARTIWKKSDSTWQVYIPGACPALYGPYGYVFEPGEVYTDSLTEIYVAGVFRVNIPYLWYGRYKTLVSDQFAFE